MEYAILIAETSTAYRIVAAVASYREALELAKNYIVAAAERDLPFPDRLVIVRRGPDGFYTIRELLVGAF